MTFKQQAGFARKNSTEPHNFNFLIKISCHLLTSLNDVVIFTFPSAGMCFENILWRVVKLHNTAVSGRNVSSSDDSKSEGEEIEYGYPITCGDSRAVLLFKKFVCPGINVRCVKVRSCLCS